MMANTHQIYPTLGSVADSFRGVLLDAYGVFWGGNETGVLPGAAKMMQQLVTSGKIVGVLSNSTQLSKKEEDKLSRNGLIKGQHFHFLLTSGEVARTLFLQKELPFKTPQNKFWVFGRMHPKFSPHSALFEGTSYTETEHIEEADFIYVSIPHLAGEDQTDPKQFYEQVQQLKCHNLPMLCANPDKFAHEGQPPRAVVRQGSIAEMYGKMGGQVHYIGKPHPQVFSMAMQQFQSRGIHSPKEIIMVGDTPETDIRGAHRYGLAAAALTIQTGMMADRISEHGLEKAIQALSKEDHPDFFIERLG